MTIPIAPFDPHTASDELWVAFNDTRRAIAHEFWPDEPILDDTETRREVQRNNPMVEFRRWVAMDGDEVAGSILAAFRRSGTPDEKDYARFVWAGGGVLASSRRHGVGTLLLREVHQLMHALDKTVLTMSAQTEPATSVRPSAAPNASSGSASTFRRPKKSGPLSTVWRAVGAPSCSRPSLPACAHPN